MASKLATKTASTTARVAGVVAMAALAGCGGGSGGGAPGPMLMPDWGRASELGGGGVLTYAFTLEPEALDRLITTANPESYVPAELTVSGESAGTVALRFKGADGTLTPCFEDGQQVCAKASFKVKFDHYDPARRSKGGLKRLNFHSMIDDPSLLHERLNARLFQDMEIVAPRVAHAFLTVNGERKGLFAVVEDIDGQFTQDRWKGTPSGNLYKDAWPTSIEPEDYGRALETNLSAQDHTRMLAFAQALRTAAPAEAPRVLDRWADLGYLLRFLAVDQAILNYDGVTAFYCDPAGRECTNHNFYWYQADERFWLVPWDLTDSLALHTPFDPVPAWNNPPPDCNQRITIDGSVVMAPGCDVVFRALQGAGRPAYDQALDRLLDVWNVPALHALIDGWAEEIAVAVSLDPNGPGTVAWRAAVRALKRDVVALRERAQALRDSEAVTAFGLPAPGGTSFEGLTPLPVLLNMTSESNSRSGAVHALNYDNPISGGADLRLDFELANERDNVVQGAFLQFVSWRIPVAGPGDLAMLKALRVRMKADNIRSVRIELDSPRYKNGAESPRYGWEKLIGRQVSELDLPRDMLRLPGGGTQGEVPLDEILSQVSGLIITPQPLGLSDDGLFKVGQTDVGFLQVDDVAFE